MKELILIKNGELALKGLNRFKFEDTMVKNIRRRIKDLGSFNFKKAQSTIMVEPKDENIDIDEAFARIRKVFGIAGLSKVCVTEKDINAIKECAKNYLKDELESADTFKVNAKRSDKKFPLKTPEICCQVGEYLLDSFPNLSVDVHNPDVEVMVEIRDFGVYVHSKQIKGAGGLPVGTSGKGAVLISGGIDSPVASYMMARRGVELFAVHFASPPYTSERAEMKVRDLLKKVAQYSGRIEFVIVPFTKIQEAIKDGCPEDMFTIIMRRYMMKIASKLANQAGCGCLITGESLAQVASQTMEAIACTDVASTMPVFRPLIGMDKDQIVEISREIDTFETSILPYEDCCTVFTPKHPKTKPVLKEIKEAESNLDVDSLIDEAVCNVRREVISFNS